MVAIPSWTADGVLPPIDVVNPMGSERAPYAVSLVDVIDRYSTSPDRRTILDGLLRFRAALHANGYVAGFQWLDGSFVENVETLEGRAPRDIDVVSFVRDPVMSLPTANDLLALDHFAAKTAFKVDSYFVELQQLSPSDLVGESAYWYGAWSHRRTFTWKGFLQVDLDPTEDAAAAVILAQTIAATATTVP